MTRILVIEDDKIHAEQITNLLQDMGLDYLHSEDAETALELTESHRIDLFIIDVSLPGVSGFTFTKKIREQTNAPVIFIGDSDSEAYKVYGFCVGADDYLVKPFGMLEFSCRIKAVLKRCRISKTIKSETFTLNHANHSVETKDRTIKLTPIEFDLLFELIMADGKPISYTNLIRSVWGADSLATKHALKERMHSLRQKIGKKYIQNAYGEGYFIALKQ